MIEEEESQKGSVQRQMNSDSSVHSQPPVKKQKQDVDNSNIFKAISNNMSDLAKYNII